MSDRASRLGETGNKTNLFGDTGGARVGSGPRGAEGAEAMASIETRSLPNGDYASVRANVPSGMTLRVYWVTAQTDSNTSPSGLTAQVVDETNNVTELSTGQKFNSGDPLLEKAGAFDASFRIDNATNSSQNVTGVFNFVIV